MLAAFPLALLLPRGLNYQPTRRRPRRATILVEQPLANQSPANRLIEAARWRIGSQAADLERGHAPLRQARCQRLHESPAQTLPLVLRGDIQGVDRAGLRQLHHIGRAAHRQPDDRAAFVHGNVDAVLRSLV
jgi:hypothetical protein